MSRFVLRIMVWGLWRHFCKSLKSVLGHSNVAQARHEEYYLRHIIGKENGCDCGDASSRELTWDNTPKTDRAIFARWVTLREFCQWGETLALFRAADFPKIMEALGGKG